MKERQAFGCTGQEWSTRAQVPSTLSRCSNRAATRVILLKGREKRHGTNAHVCSNFASPRNVQQTIALPSHGRGRWFDPSIAHSKSILFAGKTCCEDEGPRTLSGTLCSNRQISNALVALNNLSSCPCTAELWGSTLALAITFTAAYPVQ